MMTDSPNSGERTSQSTDGLPWPATCSRNREQRGLPIDMRRIMGLDTAAKLLGKGRMSDELCISVRALNMKINSERGISDCEVVSTYVALEERGLTMLVHALKLRAAMPAAPDWRWWSGAINEWYEHGPFTSRDQAVAALAGEAGHVIEGLQADPIALDAASLLTDQYFENNDAFDFEHGEPDRVGNTKAIGAADLELQQLLDGWCARWGKTFARGNMFAATRNSEAVEQGVRQ